MKKIDPSQVYSKMEVGFSQESPKWMNILFISFIWIIVLAINYEYFKEGSWVRGILWIPLTILSIPGAIILMIVSGIWEAGIFLFNRYHGIMGLY